MVYGCRTTWGLHFSFFRVYPVHAFPFKNNPHYWRRCCMRLYPAGNPLFTEVGSLPDFFGGNCLFPVDELMVSESFLHVIEPVV